jgi:hypothetical protein
MVQSSLCYTFTATTSTAAVADCNIFNFSEASFAFSSASFYARYFSSLAFSAEFSPMALPIIPPS